MRGWAQALGEAFDLDETQHGGRLALAELDRPRSKGLRARSVGEGSSARSHRFLLDRTRLGAGQPASRRTSTVDRDGGPATRRRASMQVRRVDRTRVGSILLASQLSGPDGLNIVVEVAHDIRSPITSIRCLAETLERETVGTDQ
jgi:hypothetical protein